MTTITELAKTTGTPKADLSAKAGELGFKGGLNASLPDDIEEKLTAAVAKSNTQNGNGKAKSNGNGSLSLSTEGQVDLNNPNLEEELKVAAAIGITHAELLLEARQQAFEQRLAEGDEETVDHILSLYKEGREALANLQAARPTQKRQSITEKFAELQAQIAKK